MAGMTCEICKAKFFPIAADWGDTQCGDCIGAGIEFALLRAGTGDARKPSRRAAVEREPAVVAEPERKAG